MTTTLQRHPPHGPLATAGEIVGTPGARSAFFHSLLALASAG